MANDKPRSVSLQLKPGSNVVTLVTPGDYTVYAPNLATLLSAAIGAKSESIGTKGGLTFYLIGKARPVSIRVLPPTPERLKWYTELGSVVGPDAQYVSLAIDWRGETEVITWESDTWVAPPGSKAVRGAANWPDYATAEQYREWLGQVKTDELISKVGGAVAETVEAASEAGASALSVLKWPLILVGAGWLAWATRGLWGGRER